MRNDRRFVLGATLLALAMVVGACGSGGDGDGNATTPSPGGTTTESPKGPVTVGVSADFAEQRIVAEMYALVLENDGFEVAREFELGSREASEPALQDGQIDLKPEYLGSLLDFYSDADPSSNANDNVGQLRPLLAEQGLTLLEFSAADDTNAIVVTADTAGEHGLSVVSDLAAVAGELSFGGPPECPERPRCLPGLTEIYGIEFAEFVPLDFGPRVDALEAGEIDVALLFSTDAVIGANGWVHLEDDGGLQPAENITPEIRTEVLEEFPEIEELLNAVSAALDTETMITLNGRVQIDQEDAADVARDFLETEGLL